MSRRVFFGGPGRLDECRRMVYFGAGLWVLLPGWSECSARLAAPGGPKVREGEKDKKNPKLLFWLRRGAWGGRSSRSIWAGPLLRCRARASLNVPCNDPRALVAVGWGGQDMRTQARLPLPPAVPEFPWLHCAISPLLDASMSVSVLNSTFGVGAWLDGPRNEFGQGRSAGLRSRARWARDECEEKEKFGAGMDPKGSSGLARPGAFCPARSMARLALSRARFESGFKPQGGGSPQPPQREPRANSWLS